MPRDMKALDEAVIGAFEKFMDEHLPVSEGNGPWLDYRTLMPVVYAARARRAAMRPHKIEVLRRICRENGGVVGEEWNELSAVIKNVWRESLAEILAAPSEEEAE